MTVTQQNGIVGRITTGYFPYQGWPTVARDESGTLYVAASGFRLGHICPFGKNVLYISRDSGNTWTPPAVINDTKLDDRDAGLTYLGGGKLLLTYFNHPASFFASEKLRRDILYAADDVTRPLVDGMMQGLEHLAPEFDRPGSFVRLSRDYGTTWGDAVKVPLTAPHGPIRLRNGKLLFLGKEFHSREFFSGGTYDPCAIYAFESEDDGMSWRYLSKIDYPDGCGGDNIHEPHVAELPDGRLLGALRGQGAPVDYGFTIYFCTSDDGGKSWTHPEATGFCGSPPHLLLHSSGALILTYACRYAANGFGERARVSYDGGRTFCEEIRLGEEGNTADLGYPSTAELPDGTLITVYYQRYRGDSFCSILSTRWNLPKKPF